MSATVFSGVPQPAPASYFRSGPQGASVTGRTVAPWSLLGSVAMDAFLVCLAGLVADRLRFPLTTAAGLKRILFERPLGPSSAYLGFLVLYVAMLIPR